MVTCSRRRPWCGSLHFRKHSRSSGLVVRLMKGTSACDARTHAWDLCGCRGSAYALNHAPFSYDAPGSEPSLHTCSLPALHQLDPQRFMAAGSHQRRKPA